MRVSWAIKKITKVMTSPMKSVQFPDDSVIIFSSKTPIGSGSRLPVRYLFADETTASPWPGMRACERPWLSLPLEAEHSGHDAGYPLPILGFDCELLQAGFGDGVVPRLSIVLGDTPRPFDPSFFFQTLQREIERPVINKKNILGLLSNRPRDPLPMARSKKQRLQDQ